jgi:hypothetical protein
MSFNYTTCVACYRTQEFYGRFVPPCPKCGYPELKTSAEYYKAMGVKAYDCENT